MREDTNLDVKPIVKGSMLQFGLYRGETFLKYVPNKGHVQLEPTRNSDMVRPHDRKKKYGGMVIGERKAR